jgi:hypothetical protein
LHQQYIASFKKKKKKKKKLNKKILTNRNIDFFQRKTSLTIETPIIEEISIISQLLQQNTLIGK